MRVCAVGYRTTHRLERTADAARSAGSRWPTRDCTAVNEPFERHGVAARALPRIAILLAATCSLDACVAPPPEGSRENPVATTDGAAAASLAAEESQARDADEEARKELLATAWVKDAYVSPGT